MFTKIAPYLYLLFFLFEGARTMRKAQRQAEKKRSIFFSIPDVWYVFWYIYKHRCNPSLLDGSESCASLALVEKVLRKLFSLLENSIWKGLGIWHLINFSVASEIILRCTLLATGFEKEMPMDYEEKGKRTCYCKKHVIWCSMIQWHRKKCKCNGVRQCI